MDAFRETGGCWGSRSLCVHPDAFAGLWRMLRKARPGAFSEVLCQGAYSERSISALPFWSMDSLKNFRSLARRIVSR